jgi:hypothetical protein
MFGVGEARRAARDHAGALRKPAGGEGRLVDHDSEPPAPVVCSVVWRSARARRDHCLAQGAIGGLAAEGDEIDCSAGGEGQNVLTSVRRGVPARDREPPNRPFDVRRWCSIGGPCRCVPNRRFQPRFRFPELRSEEP